MTPAEEVKTAFKKAMTFMWKEGLPNWSRYAIQHRDIVRIFLMGWGESLAGCDRDKAEAFFSDPELLETTRVDWMPDKSWRW